MRRKSAFLLASVYDMAKMEDNPGWREHLEMQVKIHVRSIKCYLMYPIIRRCPDLFLCCYFLSSSSLPQAQKGFVSTSYPLGKVRQRN